MKAEEWINMRGKVICANLIEKVTEEAIEVHQEKDITKNNINIEATKINNKIQEITKCNSANNIVRPTEITMIKKI